MRSTAPDPAAAPLAEASTTAAEAAIGRVLAAEREARAAVANCLRQAEREAQLAREQARAIAARGAQRVATAHRLVERGIEAALARIAVERAQLAQPSQDTGLDEERLRAAVETLADELTRGMREAAPASCEKATG